MQGKTAKNERRREARLIGGDRAAAPALATEDPVKVYAGALRLRIDWRHLADILLTNASPWNRLN